MSIEKVEEYSGTIPNKENQTKEEFASNIIAFHSYVAGSFVAPFNTAVDGINEAITTVNTKHDTVVQKEALMNPHYSNIDIVGENVDNLTTCANDIDAIKDASEHAQTAIQKAQEAEASAVTALNASNFQGDWVEDYNEGNGYLLGQSVSYIDGHKYVSKINNNLTEPTSETNTTEWDFLEAVNPNSVYKKDEIDNKVTTLNNSISTKQDKLLSGVNIKTINNQDIIGSGNIEIKAESVAVGDITLKYASNKEFFTEDTKEYIQGNSSARVFLPEANYPDAKNIDMTWRIPSEEAYESNEVFDINGFYDTTNVYNRTKVTKDEVTGKYFAYPHYSETNQYKYIFVSDDGKYWRRAGNGFYGNINTGSQYYVRDLVAHDGRLMFVNGECLFWTDDQSDEALSNLISEASWNNVRLDDTSKFPFWSSTDLNSSYSYPCLIKLPSGRLVLTRRSQSNEYFCYAYSDDNGDTWNGGVLSNTNYGTNSRVRLACDESGRCMIATATSTRFYSTNGSSWSYTTSGWGSTNIFNYFNDLVYEDGKFWMLPVGNADAKIAYSTAYNGSFYTYGATFTTSYECNDVLYKDGKYFFLYGQTSTLYGLNSLTLNGSYDFTIGLSKCEYGYNFFTDSNGNVRRSSVVYQKGQSFYDEDVNWFTNGNLTSCNTSFAYKVCFNSDKSIGILHPTISSTNLGNLIINNNHFYKGSLVTVNGTKTSVSIYSRVYFDEVTNKFICYGRRNDNNEYHMLSSTDGVAWTQLTSSNQDLDTNQWFFTRSPDNSKLLAFRYSTSVSTTGIKYSSDNGSTWNNFTDANGITGFYPTQTLIEGNRIYLFNSSQDDNYYLAYSDDQGITWTRLTENIDRTRSLASILGLSSNSKPMTTFLKYSSLYYAKGEPYGNDYIYVNDELVDWKKATRCPFPVNHMWIEGNFLYGISGGQISKYNLDTDPYLQNPLRAFIPYNYGYHSPSNTDIQSLTLAYENCIHTKGGRYLIEPHMWDKSVHPKGIMFNSYALSQAATTTYQSRKNIQPYLRIK